MHICSNETIGGVEYHWTPDTGNVPLVADMSSDIMSRPIDVSKYGLIYAGAQKNMGPSGVTIVIVRDDLIGHALPITPSAFNYQMQAENDSMYNTPPTYAIYIAGLVLKHVKAQGGLKAMEAHNKAKAAILYDFLDDSSFYRNPGGQGRPFADERAVQAEGRRAGRRLPQGRAGQGHDPAQGPPLGRRHARLDLQRDADRGRPGAGGVHEGIRGQHG